MKLIQLTNDNEITFWINPQHIVSIFFDKHLELVKVDFLDGEHIHVKESLETVIAKIEEA